MNYDKIKYKVWTWKNPMMLHWIINPGIAFNELVLGQRVPKVTLIERDSAKTLAERTFIPCPHCGKLHSGLQWTPQNKTAFKNWFGLYCERCGKIIPCLTNVTSYVILGLTFPVWFLFKNKWKVKWFKEQKIRFSKPLNLTYSEPKFQWMSLGLSVGFFMFVFMEVLFPLIKGESLTQKGLLIGILIWAFAGLYSGFSMKMINIKRKLKKSN